MLTKDNLVKSLISANALFFLFSGAILFIGCKEDKKKIVRPPSPKTVKTEIPKPEVIEEEKDEKPVYVYSGDRFKNPFVEIGQSTVYQPDAVFNPEQAKVKGIIFSKRLKSAIIQMGGSGSYFAKGSRIIDIMGKTVKGYSSKIFKDKVVIIGEADDVFELKIRENENEEEESL